MEEGHYVFSPALSPSAMNVKGKFSTLLTLSGTFLTVTEPKSGPLDSNANLDPNVSCSLKNQLVLAASHLEEVMSY